MSERHSHLILIKLFLKKCLSVNWTRTFVLDDEVNWIVPDPDSHQDDLDPGWLRDENVPFPHLRTAWCYLRYAWLNQVEFLERGINLAGCWSLLLVEILMVQLPVVASLLRWRLLLNLTAVSLTSCKSKVFESEVDSASPRNADDPRTPAASVTKILYHYAGQTSLHFGQDLRFPKVVARIRQSCLDLKKNSFRGKLKNNVLKMLPFRNMNMSNPLKYGTHGDRKSIFEFFGSTGNVVVVPLRQV